MAEYIACRNCDSPDCKGCNLKNLETMLNSGKFDCMMNENHCINPSVDAVPVVRCKDCKYWYRDRANIHRGDCLEIVPEAWMNENDFCSYGERKE